MKRIVICCDGTWQKLDAVHPTNVVRLARAVAPQAPDGTVQIVFHLDGVGTGRGTGALAQRLDRALGGLMGHGLTETVAEAYRLLVFTYRPGDQIHIFGYSRGAYTARSLAGMIRNCGILARAHAGRVGEALDLYRSSAEQDHPDGERALAFRADYAPETVTGDDEIAWRREKRPGRDWSGAVPLRVCYIGVWDTVGSLGVPETWSVAGVVNRRHRFHDTCLSSRVLAARHAVAVDERRRNFQPSLWENVAKLNDGAGGPGAPYQQRWFPGVHGAVGGGGDDTSLSNDALLWVMEGAEGQGLVFDAEARARIAAERDPTGPLGASSKEKRGIGQAFMRMRPVDREGPEDADGLTPSVQARWRGDPGYRPRALARVQGLLG
jgi:uncharacterized protein (DUF2235 family)